MTTTWTCHRCGSFVRSDEIDSDGDTVGEERDMPSLWTRALVMAVSEEEEREFQVDLYVDGVPRSDLHFCATCSNVAIETLVALRLPR